MDTNFKKIISKLEEMHKDFPDLRFGEILQNAIDNKKKSRNFDLSNISSKQILSGLGEFKEVNKIKRRKKVSINDAKKMV